MTRQMKSSGVEWIGDIPEKWDVCKTFRLLSMPITDGPHETPFFVDEGIPFISAEAISSGNGLINFSNKRGYISEDYYKECCKKYTPQVDDIYMIKSGATTGRVAYVSNDIDFKFTIWSPLAVFRVNKQSSYPKYVYYFLLSDSYQKQIETKWSYGTQQNIGMRNIEKLFVCLPPLSEQKAIADYLDAKCAKIDAFIAKQKTVIEKLKEYKQSVITEAVTKGLNPAVPMKSSGVEWIGDIPEKWNVFRIKNVAFLKGRIGWQGLKSDEYQEDGPFLVTGKDFKNGKIDWMSCVHITEKRFDEAPEIHIRENDLLITKDGTVGKVAIAKNCPLKVSLNSGVLLIRSKNNSFFDQKFLYYVLCSNIFWMWFLSTLNGNSTIIHLYQEDFSNFSFSLPPLSEQKEIADYLDAKCAKIDAFIAKKQTVIEKMTEYKKSLIYECVTGKREIV